MSVPSVRPQVSQLLRHQVESDRRDPGPVGGAALPRRQSEPSGRGAGGDGTSREHHERRALTPVPRDRRRITVSCSEHDGFLLQPCVVSGISFLGNATSAVQILDLRLPAACPGRHVTHIRHGGSSPENTWRYLSMNTCWEMPLFILRSLVFSLVLLVCVSLFSCAIEWTEPVTTRPSASCAVYIYTANPSEL